jgi:hypothetical protein
MKTSVTAITKLLILFVSCMIVLYFIEYVILGNSITYVFVAISGVTGLYFVLSIIVRDKLHAYLNKSIKNPYINLFIRLFYIALHFVVISKLVFNIMLINPEWTIDNIYMIIINLPTFSLIGLGFGNNSTT